MDTLEELGAMTSAIMQGIVKDVSKKRNDLLEKYVLLNAEPKIKGAVTQGKLKWRGIKLVVNSFNEYQLWQRNNPISPIIKIG